MKKILLLFVTLLSAFLIKAQVNDFEKAEALQLVSANQAVIGLSADDMNNLIVASTYKNKFAGTVMVYLQQTYKGVPVHNMLQVLAFKNGKVVSNAGGRIAGIERVANNKTGMPSVTAEAAVQSAISDRKLTATEMAVAINRKDNGRKVEFGKMGVSRENITAQLMWFPSETGKMRVRLGWQVYIIQNTSPDYWLVRVDATDNSIIGLDNLTVYCNWDTPESKGKHQHAHVDLDAMVNTDFDGNNLFDFKAINKLNEEVPFSPSIVNNATYRVIPYPAESPQHPGGTPAVVSNPWDLSGAGNNATSLKWHSIGATNYDITRGNNVWAQEDQNNNNGTSAAQVTSTTTPDPLTFDFVPNFTVPPTQTTPVQNQQFNVTNLFYWNNIIHDITYQYGFDEASRNFQGDNQGRGGAGNDFVMADAQDGGGTNNANFATPADGNNPRMQMYLWTTATPQRDGDVDNGIIVHEYGHGISNRLTGTGSGCLGNAEQMGEGWSDWYALMYTHNWSTAILTDGFNNPRGIGTYALNQPVTGPGIRSQRYTTNFAINNKVYAASIPASPHDRGEIWCATLWDMAWNIMNQTGTINPNIFNPSGTGGNSVALRLVTEGMKLQGCSPGFISGRDGILQADQIIYGGLYRCAIKEAFRRRGMGDGASQGSAFSVTDQITSFVTTGGGLTLTQGGNTAIPEQQNINYSNIINSTCGAIAGYTLTDTLPLNVTYVSGGTYNAGNRVVSWVVNQAANTTVNYNFTVNINVGAYFPTVTLLTQTVPAPGIPAGWAATIGVGPSNWVTSTTQSQSAPNSFFAVDNATAVTDFRLATTVPVALGGETSKLTFWHNYDTEETWDGGVVEISIDGGTNWIDLGPNMIVNGYNSVLDPNPLGTNPLRGRPAFSGNSGGWIQTTVNLLPYANQNALFRFRMTSDDNTASIGWYVDDILVQRVAQVNMRSSLFNAAMVRQNVSDTVTLILPPIVGCTIPSITQQPANASTCPAGNASFTSAATGTPPLTYQWQESINGGGTWNNITNGGIYGGATTTTLTLTGVTAGMNNYQYRMVVAGCSPPNANSNAAVLTVSNSVGGSVTPANSNVCGVTNSGTLTLSGHTGSVIRWEFSINGGGSWTNIANTGTTHTYTNLTQTTLFRAFVQVGTCAGQYSSIATVTFNSATPIVILADPGTTLCAGDPARLTVVEQTNTTFSNPAPITINASGNGTPYPSNIVVSGLPTSGVSVKSVTITGITHTWSEDVDIMLQSPTGQNVILISDIDGSGDYSNHTYVLDDAAATTMAGAAPPPSGTYRPTNSIGAIGVEPDNFPAPGPGAVNQPVPTLATYTGNFNGTWRLFVVDDAAGDAGTISGGYSITFSSQAPVVGGTFLWTPAAGLNCTTCNPVAASPAVTTTYTVNHDNGAGCVRQANITINVNVRPAATAQPQNTSVCAGSPATFTVTAVGAGLTYQWQVSTNGGVSYTNLSNGAPYSGVNTATLTVNPTTVAMNNYRYRVALSGTCPPVAYSNGAILTVVALPAVTITPAGPICGGVAGISGVLLTASGANTYTWAPATGLYTNSIATTPYIAGTNSATVYAAPAVNTVYTVTGNSTTTGCSNTASITVNYTPVAPTVSPASATMCLGNPAVALTITSSLAPVTVTAASGPINVPIPDGTGAAATSDLTISGIPGTAVISNISVNINVTHTWVGDVDVNLRAPNNNILNLVGGLDNGAGGNTTDNFTNTTFSSTSVTPISGAAAPRTGIFAAEMRAGYGPVGYIQNTTSWNGLTSVPNGTWRLALGDWVGADIGSLTSWNMSITYGVPAGGVWTPNGAGSGLYTDAAASTVYTGAPAVTVYAMPTTTTTYTVTVNSGTCNSLPRTVLVTVNNPINITVHPVNQVICTDKVAVFTVAATGTNPTYQWQVSTDNGNTWTNISNGGVYSGATSTTLTITNPPVSMSGYQYRAVVSGAAPCAPVNSAARLLTVNPLPTVVISAAPYTALFPGLTTTLSSSVSPAAAIYTWLRNGNPVPGGTGPTLLVDVDGIGDYTLMVTDINGCINTSNLVQIGDSANGRVFIYPNPNSGRFQVRYYSALNNIVPRGLVIYDAKGAKVLVQSYTISAPYSRMDVDLSKFGKGVYWVELTDAGYNRIAVGRVVIQ